MDSLDLSKQLKTEIYKKLFRLKPPKRNGLVLNIHQTSNKRNIRFILCDFHTKGNILALANNDGQIYLIDFLMGKYWSLKKLDSCTCIKLSEFNEAQILVGKSNGVIEVLNIDSGVVMAKLLGHQYPVNLVSFAESNVCISASKYEALVWDLSTYSKLQVLCLENNCALKFVHFVPVSNHILVCYQDDIIQIWQNGTFRSLKQFLPSNWKNYSVKSITYSRNGKIMVVSGYLPVLAIFVLDIWRLLKIINLPEYINTVRKIQFIPQNFDGGCNRLLAILSGNGIIYFYDVENNVLLSELKSKTEINNFHVSLSNVHYMSCVLGSGEVEIYDIMQYVMTLENTVFEKAQEIQAKVGKNPILKKRPRKIRSEIKNQLDDMLEIDKLKAIIKEYNEFPEAYRSAIWEKILKLPNNVQQYNSIVNHVTIVAFGDLYLKFPLEDKVMIRCLRHLLNNVVTWCPFFAQVDFLPCFLFPFVKVLHKKSVACFELCCTILVNWCQHWFEYHPLPPVNILAIIDNVLIEQDSSLLHHFASYNIKPNIYSWPLLETAFSEVLTATEWLKFWDHVFINESAFLMCAVAAYNILQKKYLFFLTTEEDFHMFFHSQRPIDVKKLINKTYFILNNTCDKVHPRQYLNNLESLKVGRYPNFMEYPKNVVKFQTEHVTYLENELKEINDLKEGIKTENLKRPTFSDLDIKNEEERRMIDVEKACIEKIKIYQESLKSQQEQLRVMRTELLNQEQAIIDKTQKKLEQHKTDMGGKTMNLLLNGLEVGDNINQAEIAKLEDSYLQKYLNLTQKQQKIEELLENEGFHNSKFTNELVLAYKENRKLKCDIGEAKRDWASSLSPTRTNISLSISMMNKLMDEIKSELSKEHQTTNYNSLKNNLKVHSLEKETQALQKDISQLLRLLIENREDCDGDNNGSSSPECYNVINSKTVRFSR